MKLLKEEQIKTLTTKRLLNYRTSLLECHETPNWDRPNSLSKQHPLWIETMNLVKAELSTREHVEKT
mgnify:CR=1 FL=1